MKDELAEDLLRTVMRWEGEQLAEFTTKLQSLATLKYDSYELYRPGVKFVESLASWLDQFESLAERRAAVEFVLERLVFISRAELDHLIEVAYRDIVRQILIRKTAAALSIRPYAVTQIVGSSKFAELRRKLLIIGLSDGARLDRLRRASPDLSHEQFYPSPSMGERLIENMAEKLERALAKHDLDGPAQFEHVLLVDDFSGSGFTQLRSDDGAFDGKLWNAQSELEKLRDASVLSATASVSVLLYVATERAINSIGCNLKASGLSWPLDVVQILPKSLTVDKPEIVALCERYYDDTMNDEHKGKATTKGRVPLGFWDVALPLVLHHNTPNDSICLLWADTSEVPNSAQRHALFPRYERHHSSRP
jgi:hypothetical protein